MPHLSALRFLSHPRPMFAIRLCIFKNSSKKYRGATLLEPFTNAVCNHSAARLGPVKPYTNAVLDIYAKRMAWPTRAIPVDVEQNRQHKM